MDYNTFTLANGLRIIHLPSPSPVLYCGYGINAGTRDELPGEEGLAHFCEHTTFKGTNKRKAWHILNCLERVGGDLNAFTTKEDTVYYVSILGEHMARAVDLLTDIVFNSRYPQQEIDKEVEVICDEIESYNDSPAELIYDDFENMVFCGHPLGHNILGQADQLRTYTTLDALRFTRRYYRPDNAVFFAYGNIDFGKLVRLLRHATSGIEGGAPKTDTAKAAAAKLPAYSPQELAVDKGTHQTHVIIGTRAYSVFDEKRIALYLLNNIIGGPGMNARLNISLRERNGLVYTAESTMTNYTDTGVWGVYFGCDPHDVGRCRRLVRKELDRLMLRPMSAMQLNAAKKQLKGQVAVAGDNRESFALGFAKSYLHYGWKKDVGRLFAQIDALTPADLQSVANEVFAKERLTTLMFK